MNVGVLVHPVAQEVVEEIATNDGPECQQTVIIQQEEDTDTIETMTTETAKRGKKYYKASYNY